jgi:hypothetical protein
MIKIKNVKLKQESSRKINFANRNFLLKQHLKLQSNKIWLLKKILATGFAKKILMKKVIKVAMKQILKTDI